MGKHKKHKRKDEEMDIEKDVLDLSDIEETGNINSGIDQNQLSNLLGNIDINQVLGLLSTIDIGQLGSMMSQFGMGGGSGDEEQKPRNKGHFDKKMEVLNAIKPMVNSERGKLIDMVVQFYAISKILKK